MKWYFQRLKALLDAINFTVLCILFLAYFYGLEEMLQLASDILTRDGGFIAYSGFVLYVYATIMFSQSLTDAGLFT
jgi:hypothetical protein